MASSGSVQFVDGMVLEHTLQSLRCKESTLRFKSAIAQHVYPGIHLDPELPTGIGYPGLGLFAHGLVRDDRAVECHGLCNPTTQGSAPERSR